MTPKRIQTWNMAWQHFESYATLLRVPFHWKQNTKSNWNTNTLLNYCTSLNTSNCDEQKVEEQSSAERWHHSRRRFVPFLGAFAKFRKVTSKYLRLSVRPPAWSNSVLTERIFIKFYESIFRKSVEKFQYALKSDPPKNVYFTWRPLNIFGHFSLNSS
jgi:hypothetical protein